MNYSPGVISLLPIFYIGWSDSVLSPAEMQTIREYINQIPHLSTADKRLLVSWTDQRNPPSPATFAEWENVIRQYAQTLDLNERKSLVEMGIAMAKQAVSAEDTIYDSPAVKASIEQFEKMMGLDNELSHLSFINNISSERGGVEVANAPAFDVEKMNRILEGDYYDLKLRVKRLLKDEFFRIPVDLRNKDELRPVILNQCRELARQGLGAYSFPEQYGGHGSVGGTTAIFEALAYGNLSLLIKFGVQFGLFGGAVYQLGTKHHHDAYLTDLGKLTLPGCFAMTETGHGSNVRNLQTTATYDPVARQLTVHSPTYASGKEYIGNALHSKMAAVFCQLIVADENHGIHCVLVPIRDDKFELMPGVTIKDCGYKMGLNGVDNGRIWFDKVRVPVENLLNRFGDITAEGRYTSPIENPSKRFFTMLGALVGGRVSVALGSNSAAKKALDIAVSYALKRRQFNSLSDEQETLLLDYPTHQSRLFPLLAKSYALNFALETLRKRYAESIDSLDKRKVESLAAGLKSYASWHATTTIQECREACGGKGYLDENELPDLKADTDVFTTFEGDNYVLLQLVAKSLLTEYKDEFSDGGFVGVFRQILKRVQSGYIESNFISSRNTDAEHLLSRDFHRQALAFREDQLLYKLADRMRNFIARKLSGSEVFIRTQTHLISLAMAHVERFINEEFCQVIEEMEESPERQALEIMQELYALDAIYRDRGWFLENDFINADKSKAILKVMTTKLYRQIRPQADTLVKAFGIPEVLRNAEVLRDEKTPFEKLFDVE